VARKSVRITNPFYFGDLALDEAFTDRAPELDALKKDMLNGQNVALIAPRRYGKSSLVRRASQELAADEGVLVAEIDLMKAPTREPAARGPHPSSRSSSAVRMSER